MNLHSDILKKIKSYNQIEETIQFNFSNYSINPNKIIDEFYLQDDDNYKITKKYKIVNIDIAKCQKIYYNETIKKFHKSEQDIIILGALIMETDKSKLNMCLEDIKMDDSMINEIENDMEEMSNNESILNFFNSERDINAIKEGIKEEEMEAAREEGYSEGLKEGIKDTSIKIAQNLLSKNVDIDVVASSTGLSKEELEKLN